MALVSLGTGYWCWQRGDAHWQTMVFTVLTLSQLANVMAIRSERESLFRLGLLSNRHLLAAVALTFALQMAVTYLPFPRQTFRIEPLGVVDLGACLALASTVFWAVEVEKWVLRRTRRKSSAVHL
jgi:Ca2+-transporting ATPase